MNQKERVCIIGAGPAGLTAATEISAQAGYEVQVLEKADIVGGISRTEVHNGYRFDIGGHRFYTKDREIEKIWHELLGEDFIAVNRSSRIYHNNRFLRYPLRLWDTIYHLGFRESILVCLSYLKSVLFLARSEKTFEDWVINRFGARLYRLFFKDYTEKVWGIPCSSIQADWAAQRIKGISFVSAIANAIRRKNAPRSMIETFYYPKLGPGMMWDALHQKLVSQGGQVDLNSDVISLIHKDNRLTGVEYRKSGEITLQEADYVISSVPLNQLVKLFVPSPPPAVLRAADSLSYRSIVIVILIIDQKDLFPDQWLYINSSTVEVGRIQNFKNWARSMVPDDETTSLGMEYFCNEDDETWGLTDKDLVSLASAELEKLNIAKDFNITDSYVVRQPNAYPLYNQDFKTHIKTIKSYLERFDNIQTIGRGGMHRYNNMDHSMMTGLKAAENLEGQINDLWEINSGGDYLECAEETTKQRTICYDIFFNNRGISAAIIGVLGIMVLYIVL